MRVGHDQQSETMLTNIALPQRNQSTDEIDADEDESKRETLKKSQFGGCLEYPTGAINVSNTFVSTLDTTQLKSIGDAISCRRH